MCLPWTDVNGKLRERRLRQSIMDNARSGKRKATAASTSGREAAPKKLRDEGTGGRAGGPAHGADGGAEAVRVVAEGSTSAAATAKH